MRVVVLGGTGVFGRRVADLLARDGHDVLIVARNAGRVAKVAAEVGAEGLALDADAGLGSVWPWAPDLLVDAVGPFDADRPGWSHRIEACLASGVDYADLCDDAAFAMAVSAFDARAKALGRRVLSGVSSVPALSSAAARAGAASMDEVDSVRTAIVPGNRAPRGPSVVEGILVRLGRSVPSWEGGLIEPRRTWTDRRVVELAPGLRRAAFAIEVPDTRLMGFFVGARTATFHAGLELGLFAWSVWLLSWLRARVPFAWPPLAVRGVVWAADRFGGWGSDVGGMHVEVLGWKDGAARRWTWTLVARSGHGPWIPAVPVRALARAWAEVPIGAGPCLGVGALPTFEAACADLDVAFASVQAEVAPLVARALGPEVWLALPAAVRASHEVLDVMVLEGQASVERGQGWAGRLVAWLFRFPPAAPSVPVRVTKRAVAGAELWTRDFGGKRFRSTLSDPQGDGGIQERFGPFAFALRLGMDGDRLMYRVRGARLGPLRFPAWVLPKVEAFEREDGGGLVFDVAIHAPLGLGLAVRYTGVLHPVPRAQGADAPCTVLP